MLGVVAGRDADDQRDIERHEARRLDLHVVAGKAIGLEESAQLALEGGVDLAAAGAIHRDEDRVPGAGPAPRGDRALHVRMFLSEGGIVLGRDRPLLPLEGARRRELDRGQGLGIRPARRRQRIDDPRR